jgi:catechol-2,3-dioxygenase
MPGRPRSREIPQGTQVGGLGEADQEVDHRHRVRCLQVAVKHLALAVADEERSRRFYESYFGFDVRREVGFQVVGGVESP